MSLHERTEFPDYLLTVGERSGAGAAIVEKDYWVTEALRVIAREFRQGVVFKGGTSLSKGWQLIDRFSEDIDLLIKTGGSDNTRGKRDRYMKDIEEAVAEVSGMSRSETGSRSERGISRTVVFEYEPQSSAMTGLSTTIVLEMGIRGGDHPVATRELQSLLAEHLRPAGLVDETLELFELDLLDFRRTFLEKLFAVHSAVSRRLEGEVTALERQGRHYYDLYQLLARQEVLDFIGTDEYDALSEEIDAFGREFFPTHNRAPAGLRFAQSPALTPSEDLREALEAEYGRNRYLYYGGFPTLSDVFERLARHRERL